MACFAYASAPVIKFSRSISISCSIALFSLIVAVISASIMSLMMKNTDMTNIYNEPKIKMTKTIFFAMSGPIINAREPNGFSKLKCARSGSFSSGSRFGNSLALPTGLSSACFRGNKVIIISTSPWDSPGNVGWYIFNHLPCIGPSIMFLNGFKENGSSFASYLCWMTHSGDISPNVETFRTNSLHIFDKGILFSPILSSPEIRSLSYAETLKLIRLHGKVKWKMFL